jgi:hypothetical protein
MRSILRTILVVVGTLATCAWATAQASVITYSFDFSVRALVPELQGGPVNAGDTGTVTFRVDAATPSDQGGVGWARYSGAIVGGGVTIRSLSWTFGGPGDDYVVIWNEQPLGNELVEGISFVAPLQGPSVNGWDPFSFETLLVSFNAVPSDALTSLSFPTSLDLANFQNTGAAQFFSQPFLGVGYYLDLNGVRVIPEPATPLLFVLGLAMAWVAGPLRRTQATHGATRRFVPQP